MGGRNATPSHHLSLKNTLHYQKNKELIVRIRIFTLLSFIMNVIINCKTQKKNSNDFFKILCKNHFQRSGFAFKIYSNGMYFQITINPLYLFLSLSVLQEFESDAHLLLTKCSFHQF